MQCLDSIDFWAQNADFDYGTNKQKNSNLYFGEAEIEQVAKSKAHKSR